MDPMDRFDRAVKIGKPALLRLRAEGLLQRANAGEIPLTEAERETLERIAAAPKPGDEDFLGDFDQYLSGDGDE